MRAPSAMDALLSLDQLLTPAPLLASVGNLALLAGVTPAEVRLFLCLLLAYPAAGVWRHLPFGRTRHLFSVVVGGWMLQFVNGYQAVYNLASVLACYALMLACGARCARAVCVLAMAVLAGGHLYRQVTDYLGWTLDWTLVAMVTTQKVMGLAYNVQDAHDDGATAEQKLRSVAEVPSLLEFLGFILFPGNVIIGPGFEYTDYKAFAEGIKVSPPPYAAAAWRLFQGLFFFVAHTAIATKYPCGELLGSKEFFQTGSWMYRYVVIWIGLVGVRFKYYFGWKIAEGAGCMGGLGYNGVDKTTGQHRWDRLENIDVLAYETSQSLRTSSQNWNKTTNKWLRRYVYDRAPASVNLYLTYLISAFWHGFYPGYYMFFLSVAAATMVHRQIRRKIRPRFLLDDGKTAGPYKGVYDAMSIIATSVTLNYFIMSFVLLASDRSLAAFKGFNYFGHIGLGISFAVFNSSLIKAPRKNTPAKKD